jgi:hypothetical protein
MTGGEPGSPVLYRVVMDHPRLSWSWLWTGPHRIEFLIGPPTGRALDALLPMQVVIESNVLFIDQAVIQYADPGSSFGVLAVTFTQPPIGGGRR